MKIKISPATLILSIVFLLLLTMWILELTGITSLVEMAYGNFDTFIFALIFVSFLSIVGAIFLGMFISHKILSVSGFTPFEEEMLRMREDIKEIKNTLEEKDD